MNVVWLTRCSHSSAGRPEQQVWGTLHPEKISQKPHSGADHLWQAHAYPAFWFLRSISANVPGNHHRQVTWAQNSRAAKKNGKLNEELGASGVRIIILFIYSYCFLQFTVITLTLHAHGKPSDQNVRTCVCIAGLPAISQRNLDNHLKLKWDVETFIPFIWIKQALESQLQITNSREHKIKHPKTRPVNTFQKNLKKSFKQPGLHCDWSCKWLYMLMSGWVQKSDPRLRPEYLFGGARRTFRV